MKETGKILQARDRLPRITLKRRAEIREKAQHPWIFSNEVADPKLLGRQEVGGLVEVIDCHGDYLGTGFCHPKSLIAVRILSRTRRDHIDADFFSRKIEASLALRESIYGEKSAARSTYRAVFGESDGLPGFVLDRFNDVWVMQFHSAGLWKRKEEILAGLVSLVTKNEGAKAIRCVVGRTDVQSASLEGMEDAALVLHGEIPSEGVFAEEAGVRFPVDPVAGQKTGFYFDQRENRAAFARLVSARALAGEDVHVADLYCHLGAWGFAALSAGAKHVTFLDSSERALGAVKKILRKMDWEDRATVICGDAKEEIRKLKADSAKSFDLVSLDPPSFIPNRKSAPQGLKAYGSMNSLAGELVKPGGILATSSCSHNCLEERFEAITAEALRKIGRDPRLVLRGWPAYDHPARPGMPESNYLKCLFYAI